MWWCGQATGGDGIFYSRLTASGWTSPQLVLSASSSGWDSKHVCDPSVIKGSFSIGGTSYTYAMYYTATYDTVGYDSHIGVAFSNDGVNWTKYSGNPIIAPSSSAAPSTLQYGAGMQTAYRASGTSANVTLAFFDSTSSGSRAYMVTSTNGVTFGSRTELPNPIGDTAIGDIAYSPSENVWYIATKHNSDTESYVLKSSGSSLTSAWQEWGGRINNILTGNAKNHNPGFIRQPNGDIYTESGTQYKYVLFGTGGTSPSDWNIGQAIVTDGWLFDVNGNKQGWTTANVATDSGPSGGLWVVTANALDPYWQSPPLSILSSNFSKVEINMANQNANTTGKVYFKTHTEDYYSESKSVSFTVSNSGGWDTYTVNLSANTKYTGMITGLRVDPIETGSNAPLGINYIKIVP
ncbi:hypothetical protein [Paenibacillus mendelii]|uniref:Exo-alpha-sialidase n=1 Tax=Paenibacillus mendelii TaxID=206163 RepID=A0ABV6JJR6_9BACL|nr:hypothetical protein [Paenibacillus mendelii]MCQ6559082.1 hypothetical protein [Paenibacillus mendelii]